MGGREGFSSDSSLLSKDTGELYSSLGDFAFPLLSESAAWQDLHTLHATFPNLGTAIFSFRHLLQYENPQFGQSLSLLNRANFLAQP